MVESNGNGRSPLSLILIFLFVIVLPLAIGLYISPRLVPAPQIGIVRLNYDIGSESAREITRQLAYAEHDPAIRAVVLVINSPGGSAAYSEELYLSVLNARKTMPVVATIDLVAASGAYYMAAAADEIYAKPTSSVGSIGVIASLPGEVFIEEDLLTTGPYKAFGGTRDSFTRQIERAKYAFLQAIATGRGERLKADLDYLSRAEIYTGVEALDLGLIDGLIANEDATARAAELAGLSSYEVVEIYPLVYDVEESDMYAPLDAVRLWAPPDDLPAGLYYRHIVPAER